jgi:hypothetical protein
MMQEAGTVEFVQDTLKRIAQEARAEITRLGGNAVLEGYLNTLADVE